MKRVWHTPAKVTAGLFVAALYAMPQAYTISARPGVINYIEGAASMNGQHISGKVTGRTFLATNDTLSTENGKAEVLLTPGVFLRVGADSEIRMISPSLTKTVVEVLKGEAFVEAADLVKENDIEILDHGATTRLLKPGLYRFTATDQPLAAVIMGKAEVQMGGRKIDLGKNRQAVLDSELKAEKFDSKKQSDTDDLYAWSKVRDEYEAASSFATAKTAMANSYYGGGLGSGYGYNGYGMSGYGMGYGPGWAWNPAFSSWAWLPGDGAFFSPFGYGFFAPGVVAYAPVAYVPVGGGGKSVAVPVNPSKPPAMGTTGTVSAGSRPSRPTIYTTTGTAYRGSSSPIGNAPSGHVTSSAIASSARGGSNSGSSSGSGGYGGGSSAASSNSGSAARSSGGSYSGGGMSGGGGASHASSGGGSHR